MVGKTKGSRATLVKQSAVEDARVFLQALPEKPKEDLSLKETVDKLKAPLQAALAKGYTYPELAAQLESQGIHISATTLKNYLPSGKRSGKGQSTTTPKRAAKQVRSTTSTTSIASSSSGEVSPAAESVLSVSPTSQRGRGKMTTGTARKSKATATKEPAETSAPETDSRSRSRTAKTPTSTKQAAKSAGSQRAAATRSKSSKTAKK